MKKTVFVMGFLFLLFCMGGCGNRGVDDAETGSSHENIDPDQTEMEGIIEEQSFEVELDDWGKVTFAFVTPENGSEEPYFVLLRDGEVVYTFPRSSESEWGEYVEVSAVSFQDYNMDGKLDVIVLIQYGNGEDACRAAQVFLQENSDNMFYMDYPVMKSYQLTEESDQGPGFYRDTFLEEYLFTQRLTDTVSDMSGAWEGYLGYIGWLNNEIGFWQQLELLAQNKDVWAHSVDYADDRYCFALADLDYDGKIELITAHCGGTGYYTYSEFYKIDENGDLKKLETSFAEGDSQPDIIEDQMTLYSSFRADGIRDYYIVYDTVKVSAAEYVYRVSSLCVEDDFVLETFLADKTVTYDAAGTERTEMIHDCSGNVLTEEKFQNFPHNYYSSMGLTKQTAAFGWTDMSLLAGKSEEEIVELLKQSEAQFVRE